ncbi:MAG: hypothetical protein WA817_09800 [Candidatus Acidiferrum sp.]
MPLDSEIHRHRRDDLGISTAALSEIVGIHRNKLGAWISGVGALTNTEILKVNQVLDDLDLLVLAAAPFPPAFQNVVRIKDLLLQLHAGVFAEKIQQEKSKKEKEQQ